MDQRRQAALRKRADDLISAALAAADVRSRLLTGAVSDAMAAVELTCWDDSLAPSDRLSLIDEALRLMSLLKEFGQAPAAARPALAADALRLSNGLLRRYARLVRAERTGS